MAHPDIPTDRWRARFEQALDRLREEAHALDDGADARQWLPGEVAARVVQEEGRGARLVIEIPIESWRAEGVGAAADNDVVVDASSAFWDVEQALATRYERLRRLEHDAPRDDVAIGALQSEIDALEGRQVALLDVTLAAHRPALPDAERVRETLARHGIELPESLRGAR